MKKTIYALILALVTSFTLHAQELEEWEWTQDIVFSLYSDMNEITNNSSEFEASSDNIHSYYAILEWDFDDYEDMGASLGLLAVEKGFSSDAEIEGLGNINLPGAYIQERVDGVNMIFFIIGNPEYNIAIAGYLTYATGYKQNALSMIKSIQLIK